MKMMKNWKNVKDGRAGFVDELPPEVHGGEIGEGGGGRVGRVVRTEVYGGAHV